MTTPPTPYRCPHAASCWMGGGSYACVKTPPFCDEPLIPKATVERISEDMHQSTYDAWREANPEMNVPEATGWITPELPALDPIQSAIKQGDLF